MSTTPGSSEPQRLDRNNACGIHCSGAWVRQHEEYDLGVCWTVRVRAAGGAARG